MLEEELKEIDAEAREKLHTERDNVSKMIRDILSSALKDNPHLQKGILTGVFDTLKKDAGSGLNNIKIYSITDQRFSTSYGFSKEEIEQQLIHKMFKNQDEHSEMVLQELSGKITELYNGYTVPVCNGYMQNYNPFAVINYLSDCICDGKLS